MLKKVTCLVLFFLGLLLPVTCLADSSDFTVYEREYSKKLFGADTGFLGNTAKSICSSGDGFLWIGSYTGLYKYNGKVIDAVDFSEDIQSVNTVFSDSQDRLWIGTNGDGIYLKEGLEIRALKSDSGTDYSINWFAEKNKYQIYVATNLGLFCLELKEGNWESYRVPDFGTEAVRQLLRLPDGGLVVVTAGGEAWYYSKRGSYRILPQGYEADRRDFRCVSKALDKDDQYYFLGTEGGEIYRIWLNEDRQEKIETGELSSFNDIAKAGKDTYWLCSDTGIGMLKEDRIYRFDFPVNNSVDCVCQDYQGDYWFASSRQGIMELEKNQFWDLGEYLRMDNVTVNSIGFSGDKAYYGTDSGLLCYRGRKQIKDDPLVTACGNNRIRQVYADREENLWITTHSDGVYVQEKNGQIRHMNADNSGLTENQVRCIRQRRDGTLMLGTKAGLFLIEKDLKTIRRFCDDSFLNGVRVLTVIEYGGRVYVGTDGSGLFCFEDEKRTGIYTKRDGLESNVIMHVVDSKQKSGVWVISGVGISFLSDQGEISPMNKIPVANSLDLIMDKQSNVYILAGNGLFVTTEAQMFSDKEPKYVQYTMQNGLPVDITANARNVIYENRLYISGTGGAAALPLGQKESQVILKGYVDEILADGKRTLPDKDGVYVVPANTHRVSVHVDFLNYTMLPIDVYYYLENEDEIESVLNYEKFGPVEYTNLAGGKYRFTIRGVKPDEDEDIALSSYSVNIRKELRFWEKSWVQVTSGMAAIAMICFLMGWFLRRREVRIEDRYREKYHRVTQKELERMAYKDSLTGMGNGVLLYSDLESMDSSRIYALMSVGINHVSYNRFKYSDYVLNRMVLDVAGMLRETFDAQELYRISDYIFAIVIRTPMDLEETAFDLKERFRLSGESQNRNQSLSVGFAVLEDGDTLNDVFEKCGETRKMDEHLQEEKFIESAIRRFDM